MIDNYDLIKGIASVIQRVYGDAAQTVLDRRAASEIWAHLADHGVASPEFVAAMVESAGGELVVDDRHMVDPPDEIFVVRTLDGLKLKTRRRDRRAT